MSNAEDLISLFDADFGVLVIGEGAKILGPNEHGQETLIVAEYLRLKQFKCVIIGFGFSIECLTCRFDLIFDRTPLSIRSVIQPDVSL